MTHRTSISLAFRGLHVLTAICGGFRKGCLKEGSACHETTSSKATRPAPQSVEGGSLHSNVTLLRRKGEVLALPTGKRRNNARESALACLAGVKRVKSNRAINAVLDEDNARNIPTKGRYLPSYLQLLTKEKSMDPTSDPVRKGPVDGCLIII